VVSRADLTWAALYRPWALATGTVIPAAPSAQVAAGVPENGSAGGPLVSTGLSGRVVTFTAGVAVRDARAEGDDFTSAVIWCRQDGGA
jgi:hypothetical protein